MKQTEAFTDGFAVDETIDFLSRQLAEMHEAYENQATEMKQAWERNVELIKQLAAKDAETERLQYDNDIAFGSERYAKKQLAASQAREQQLREAMNDYFNQYPHMAKGYILDALALPTDNTALEGMISEAGEVMRERLMRLRAKGVLYPADIRALPTVRLGDLK